MEIEEWRWRSYHIGCGLKQDLRLGDYAELTEAAEDGEEELGVVAAAADQRVALAGDHLQLRHVGRLRAVAEGLAADAGVGQRPPDRQAQVIGVRPRREAVAQAPLQDVLPYCPTGDDGVVPVAAADDLEVVRVRRAHVDDEAAVRHGLAVDGVAVAPGGDGQAGGPEGCPDGAGHVVGAGGADDGEGLGRAEAAEVLGGGGGGRRGPVQGPLELEVEAGDAVVLPRLGVVLVEETLRVRYHHSSFAGLDRFRLCFRVPASLNRRKNEKNSKLLLSLSLSL